MTAAATPAPRRSWWRRARDVSLLPAIAIGLALIFGAVLMILSSPLLGGFNLFLPVTAYRALLEGSVGSLNSIVNTLVNATPLVLAGLAVGIGFKGGLFNIGGYGQFLLGALCATIAAIALNDASPWVAIPVAVIAGMLGGMAWGFIPGFLKAFTGAHEVVTTIMLNFVAVYLVSYVISGPLRGTGPEVTFARTDTFVAAELPIIIGRNGHLGLIFAAVAVPLAWWLLYRSTTGFEIRTAGASPDAARYAGMHPKWLIILTMSICGMLAGLAGTVEWLGEVGYGQAFYGTTVGFDAIAVALLGRANPVGILFSALLFGAMQAGAGQMQAQAGIPPQMIAVLQAVILFFLAAETVVRRVLKVRTAGTGVGTELQTVSRSYGEQATR
ncbi:MAG TPA: ABC transporter permease [Candidatus Limnocylindria bacterium]|nr:ABC transporter permease [Candidatus Limnocylindria bacterium]